MKARAASVTEAGDDDGWRPSAGWFAEIDNRGETRLVVSVPADQLAAVHRALWTAMEAPHGVLWRQLVDRANPRPEGAKPVDHLAMEVPPDRLAAGIEAGAGAIYEDARAELWIRGRHGDQVVLDADGLVYAYPDDIAFRDVLDGLGLPEGDIPTLAQRDYVKHWYHAEHDAQEAGLMRSLGLTRVVGR